MQPGISGEKRRPDASQSALEQVKQLGSSTQEESALISFPQMGWDTVNAIGWRTDRSF